MIKIPQIDLKYFNHNVLQRHFQSLLYINLMSVGSFLFFTYKYVVPIKAKDLNYNLVFFVLSSLVIMGYQLIKNCTFMQDYMKIYKQAPFVNNSLIQKDYSFINVKIKATKLLLNTNLFIKYWIITLTTLAISNATVVLLAVLTQEKLATPDKSIADLCIMSANTIGVVTLVLMFLLEKERIVNLDKIREDGL